MISAIEAALKDYVPQPLGQQQVYAVLLPLIETDKGWDILYQVRAAHISQPGEVAFPGGRVEAGESLEAAAIRETMEELNLARHQIKVLGQIDYMVYGKRTVYCFVGQLLVEDWQSIHPNEEVDRVFTLPVKQLQAQAPQYYQLFSANQMAEDFPFERLHQGRAYSFGKTDRQIPFYEHVQENLWGMTAQFTHRFIEILDKFCQPLSTFSDSEK